MFCPAERADHRAAGLPESHTRRISTWTASTSPNSTALGADSSWRGTRSPWVSIGGWAMWIIWYIGMMASLRAMGLAPSPVPVRIDEDRKPYGDF